MSAQEDDLDINPMTRASGSTPAQEEAHRAMQQMDEELHAEYLVPDEPPSPRFMRLRLSWGNPEEMRAVRQANQAVDAVIVREFAECYQILVEIQSIVRTRRIGPDGEPMSDEYGNPVWERTPSGRIIEDYSNMSRKQQESFLGQITTRLFAWEQSAERFWMEAMMARARYEERFAVNYDDLRGSATRTTVDDRNQHATMTSSEDRYFALYLTSVSRRAQAVVRSMNLLAQRLKDLLTA